VQPREETAPDGDRGGDETGERIEPAGYGFVSLDATSSVSSELDVALRRRLPLSPSYATLT
jgi:hypothetical protein